MEQHLRQRLRSRADRKPGSKQGLGGGGRRVLITGTRGTGKRTLGYLLAIDRGFTHVNLDHPEAGESFLEDRAEGLPAVLEGAGRDADIVATWTPESDDALGAVRQLQSAGFEWIWLDGDRGAAFHPVFGYIGRGRRARFVDPFTAEGQHRALESVITEILQPGPDPTLLPARDRSLTRAPRRPRIAVPALGPRLRAGLAALATLAAAGLAAAAGYVIVGATGGKPTATPAVAGAAAHARVPALPRKGVLVSGRSLAGIKLGDTRADVRARWGGHYTVCDGCKPTTWFYFYETGDPVGAGVRFRNGRVIAVFTLGMTLGWTSDDGVRVGEVLDGGEQPGGKGSWTNCPGYGATSEPSSGAVTSVLTVGSAVYGFSLTRPNEPVCH